MRIYALILGTALSAFAQGSNQTAPMPNPYGPGLRPSAPRQTVAPRLPRNRMGGGVFLGGGSTEVIVVAPTPVKEDPLKDLVISPVYQKDKITPKMIEIP
jgi:hypothetical protein